MKFTDAAFAFACGTVSQLPEPERMEFAFIGRSNVGKSTLINKLVGRKALARVSAVPGKTATINFYSVDHVYFTDLPGYRDLRLVVQLIDMRHAPSADDIAMINELIDGEVPFIIVFTKADKLNKSERTARMAAFADEIPCFADIHAIPFSAKTFEGQDVLRDLLAEIADEPEEETA